MSEKTKLSTAGIPKGVVDDIVRGMPKVEPKTLTKETSGIRIQGQVGIIEIKANHADSLKILEDEGLRPMTYQEALVIIDTDSELKEKLKGKWFWIAGKGMEQDGLYTFDKNGKLIEGEGDPEKTVRVWSGDTPLSLSVWVGAVVDYWRFDLYADVDPSVVAPVVVGVKVS